MPEKTLSDAPGSRTGGPDTKPPLSPRAAPVQPESTASLETLLNAVDDPAVLIDRQITVLAANRAMARSLGRRLDEILGRPLLEMLPPRLAETRGVTFEHIFLSGQPVRFEEEREGVWFDYIAHPVFDAGEKVNKVALLARDITQRRRMENALRQGEATTRSILKAAPIGIGLARERVFHWVSDRMCELLRYTPGELIGSSARILYESDEEYRRVGEVKYGAMDRQGIGEVETRWKRKDGRVLDILLRSAPVHPGDLTQGITFTAQDITERKRMEQEILKVQRLESLSVLAGGIAHDFNNLLTAILACVSALHHNPHLQPHEKKMLAHAETATLRAKNLTQKILAFAKGGAPIKTTFSMETLLKETAALALSGSRSVCEFEISQDLRPVSADEGQTRQVLQNLIINADQAMPDGGRIRVRAENVTLPEEPTLNRKGGEFIRVSIQDHGCGIPEKERTRIFDPFFSTKEKGRGLGLSTAFNIMNRHEGRIHVSSQVGVGTTFQVTFPASHEPLPQQQGARIPEHKPAESILNILIVDDESIIRESTGAILERLGYRVAQARDGVEGIGKYQEALKGDKPFDAVIMDLTIPGGMGGEKAIRELKRIDPRARVIVSSGYSQDPVMSRFQDYGFSGVLPKPYRLAELQNVLAHVLSDEKK